MIIVTGGAGFIGSNLVKALQKQGEPQIVVSDYLGDHGKWKNLIDAQLYDVLSPEDLFPFLERNKSLISTIFHLGAITSTTEQDANLLLKQNYSYSLRLWEWCGAHNTPFIYASSAATYGGGEYGFSDELENFSHLRPLNVYGWSKHMFDLTILNRIKHNYGPNPPKWVGLKFFNVYGPNEAHKGPQQSLVSKFYPSLKEGGIAKLFRSYNPNFPDGGQKRDFIWVGDCVDVMTWIKDQPQTSGIFNVGTGNARSFYDLTLSLFNALGQAPRIHYIDMPDDLREQYQYFTEAKMDKLRAIGYKKPFTSIEQGARLFVESQTNPTKE